MYNTQVYKNKHKDSAMEDSILTFHVNDPYYINYNIGIALHSNILKK